MEDIKILSNPQPIDTPKERTETVAQVLARSEKSSNPENEARKSHESANRDEWQAAEEEKSRIAAVLGKPKPQALAPESWRTGADERAKIGQIFGTKEAPPITTRDWKTEAAEQARMRDVLAPKAKSQLGPVVSSTDWRAEVASDQKMRKVFGTPASAGTSLADRFETQGNLREEAKQVLGTPLQQGPVSTPAGSLSLSEQLKQAGDERERIRQQANKVFAPDKKVTPLKPETPSTKPAVHEVSASRQTESKFEQVKSMFQTSVDKFMSVSRERDWPQVERIRKELTTMLELIPPAQRHEAIKDAHEKVITELQAAVNTNDKILINSVRETAKALTELEI